MSLDPLDSGIDLGNVVLVSLEDFGTGVPGFSVLLLHLLWGVAAECMAGSKIVIAHELAESLECGFFGLVHMDSFRGWTCSGRGLGGGVVEFGEPLLDSAEPSSLSGLVAIAWAALGVHVQEFIGPEFVDLGRSLEVIGNMDGIP